ncbi:Homocysteine S-methyltransferase [Vararia minispora EC-137]|uniref:Homocysteine S-methyltransferase n=1 Tax=Vararia minispora EC-137 TaxID=1314806 RepID=A0ACB8QLY0_9AGAM|nr:Homocysteine S-methyltransferase [Vararia minispora EC-137]
MALSTNEQTNGLSEIFQPGSHVLWDGGLGTTLADGFGVNTRSPVWSSQVVEDSPDILVDCHLQFLQSGAQVLDTATCASSTFLPDRYPELERRYQVAFSTYALANHSRDPATRLMRTAVFLASVSRARFLSTLASTSPSAPPPQIALSLGAFGATLVPVAHEFDGIYPPPYGPATADRVTFTDAEKAAGLEAKAVEALADFHYERLKVFADDEETWASIGVICFETLPLRKPWLASTVWQHGRFPEGAARDVVDAAFGPDGIDTPVPDALGVNCTLLGYVRIIVRELGEELSKTAAGARPWLALKPNGGEVYDPIKRTWSVLGGEGDGCSWAEGVMDVVKEAEGSGAWAGYLVGGCCKTSFNEIRGIRDVLS